MDPHLWKCGLTNQVELVFSNGTVWNLQNPLWDVEAESSSPEALLYPAVMHLFPWQLDARKCSTKGAERAVRQQQHPQVTLFLGESTSCMMPNSQETCKEENSFCKQRNTSLQLGNACIDVWFLAAQTYFRPSFSLGSTAGCLYRLLAVYIRSIHRMGCLFQTSNKFHSAVCVYHCFILILVELERNKNLALEINKQQTLLCYGLFLLAWEVTSTVRF